MDTGREWGLRPLVRFAPSPWESLRVARWLRCAPPLRHAPLPGAPAPGPLGPGRPGSPLGPIGASGGMAAPLGGANAPPRPSKVCAPGPLCGPFCALRVPPLRRGPCPCAGPLRRGAPAAASRPRSGALRPPSAALRSPGPPLGPAPRLCRSALVRRCAAPRALAGPAALGLPLSALRASSAALRSPLLRAGLAAALRVAPPGPPWPARVGFGPPASASVGSLPARLGGAPPLPVSGGPSRLRGRRLRPRGLCCAPAPARACWVRLGAALRAAAVLIWGFAPASPPPLPPPPGARGERQAGLRVSAKPSARANR